MLAADMPRASAIEARTGHEIDQSLSELLQYTRVPNGPPKEAVDFDR